MGIFTKILAGAVAVLLLAVVVLGWQLRDAFEQMGAARQALVTAKEANDEWKLSEERHREYVEEVRKGFVEMKRANDETRATNKTFQQQVRTNARANDSLDPDELAALRLWSRGTGGGDAPGAGQGGDPGASPPVR